MNLVFISPNFPNYFWNFVRSLRERGVNVLGVGDAPYDGLREELKSDLTEYYRVNSLENYEEVYRAMGFFIGKYGRIDYVESQNEYWLELEAQLREDFNIYNGTRPQELECMKYKSKMKAVYEKAGVPVARYCLIHKDEDLVKFVDEVGFPIVVKPDNGVGAISTYKIKNKKQVKEFLLSRDTAITFIAEEFVPGHVETFDGITDSQCNILIDTSHVMMNSIMDNVNEGCDTSFYGQMVKGTDIEEIGTRVVKAFNANKKFFHFEFFRLDKDKEGLGKKGDIVGLEVNMRAPGAYMPDMMNYSYNENVYDIYADMLVHDKAFGQYEQHYCIGYVGLRDGMKYKNHSQQIKAKYGKNIISYEVVPEVLSAAMGNHVYLVKTETEKEMMKIMKYIMAKEKVEKSA